ncbi:hypothetical protein Btru_036393, partial [Bulinus truncatus]
DLVTSDHATIDLLPPGQGTDWLTDRNESTCNDEENLQSITLTWNTAIGFTWLKMAFNSKLPTYLRNVKVNFTSDDDLQLICNKTKSLSYGRHLQYRCDGVFIKQLTLTGDGIISLCGLYVSGGRNLAIKQMAVVSTNESGEEMSTAKTVDGDIGQCSHANQSWRSPVWTILLNGTLSGLRVKKEEFNNFISTLMDDTLNYFQNESTPSGLVNSTLEILSIVVNKTSQAGYYLDNETFQKLVIRVDKTAPTAEYSLTKDSQGETASIKPLISLFDRVVSNKLHSNTTDNISIVTDNIAVKIETVVKDILYPEHNGTSLNHSDAWIRTSKNEIHLSQNAFSWFNGSVRYAVFMVKNPQIIQKADTLNTTPAGVWSTDGCETLETIQDDRIICQCDHLTSFAVLMSPISVTPVYTICCCSTLLFHVGVLQSLALYTSLNNMTGKTPLKLFLVCTYAAPFIIVSLTMAITSLEGYGTTTHCWITVDKGVIWAFTGPVIAVILVGQHDCISNGHQSDAGYSSSDGSNEGRPVSGLFIFLFHCVNQRQINDAFKSFRRRMDSLLPSEWLRLEEVVTLLEPFAIQTDILQSDTQSLSTIIPSLNSKHFSKKKNILFVKSIFFILVSYEIVIANSKTM